MPWKLWRGHLKLTTSGQEAKPSNSVREYSSDPLPADLLIEIFYRVPLKSIARFRCVSKIWASILSDFTELFLTKSLTRPRLLFTVEANGKLLFYSLPQPHNPDDNSSLVVTPYHNSFPEYVPCDICKTVCGLVLLQGYSNRKVRVIYNPATGQFLTLPEVKAKSKATKIAEIYFGYDPMGKQFKVLCMTTSRDERPNTHQVLTLESGKRVWRTVVHEFHFVRNYRMWGADICIDGVLYLGAAVGESTVIVCFNVGSEKFSFINTNEDIGIARLHIVCSLILFNYKGKLGVLQRDSDHSIGAKVLVLWVLEDAGTHKWSKHSYVLSPLGSKIVTGNRFLGMIGTGEIVYSSDSFVFFYNMERNTFKRVNLQKLEGLEFLEYHRNWDVFVNYVENLKFM